jgi:hypothetical protein
VEQLIDEVVGEPGALPLLSLTLNRMYFKYLVERGRQDRSLTSADYQELGGTTALLHQRAHEEYALLSAEGGAPSCEPETGDGECFECMRSNCCAEVAACAADTACTECVECVDAEMDVGTCSVEPMNYCDVLSSGPMQAMLLCLVQACEIECGFN